MRRRWLILGLVATVALASLALWGLWRSEAFWRWSAQRLLDLAQKHLQVELQVGAIEGRPLTGLTLKDVRVKTRQGDTLQVRRVALRFSPWSLIQGQPVVSHLTLVEPHLTLLAGDWHRFAGPPPPPAPKSEETGLALKALHLPLVVVHQGRVDLVRDPQSWRLSELEGQLALDLLQPGQPQQKLLVRRAALRASTPWGPLALTGRLSCDRQLLDICSLSLEVGGRPCLSLSGHLHLDGREVPAQFTGALGPLPGAELRRFWEKWPPAWDVEGKFTLKGSWERLEVNLEGRAADAAASLQAFLSRTGSAWQAEGQLTLAHLRAELLAPWRKTWSAHLAGLTPVTARVQFSGQGAAWPPEKFRAALVTDPCRLGPRHLERLHLTLQGNAAGQQLTGTAQGNFGRLALTAKGPLLSERRGEVAMQGEGLRPHLLGVATPPDNLLNGKFSGAFRLAPGAAFPEMALAGDLEASGRWGHFPLREAKARLSWEKTRLHLAPASVHWGNLRASAKGALQPDRLDLQVEGSLAPEGDGPLPAGLKGQLSWQGSLTGDLKAPQFRMQGKGAQVAWGGWGLAGLTLSAAGEGWLPREGRLDIQGRGFKTPAGTLAQASLTAQGSEARWRFNLKAASPQGPQLALAGAAALAGRPLEITLEQAHFQHSQVIARNAGPLRLRLLPGLELGPAVFRVNDGQVSLEARSDGGALSGRLEVDNLPAGLFAIKGQPLGGRLKGRLTLGGRAAEPTLAGQFSVAPGRLGEFAFQALQTALTYRDNQLSVNGHLEQRPGGPRVTWDGRLPLRLSLIPFRAGWGEDDLRLRVQGDRADLSLLTAITPEVQEAVGPLDLAVEWQGPLAQPRVTGQVRYGAGTITFRQAGLPYRLQAGEIRLQGDSLVFPRLVFESRGTAAITGAIRLAGWRSPEVNLKARLDNFQALGRGGSEAFGSGDLVLAGPSHALLLKGRLTVPRASFRPLFFQTDIHEDIVLVRPPTPPANARRQGANAADDLARNLRLDLSLESPGGVWLRDPRFRLELAGNLKITRQPGEPARTAGKLRSLQGAIDIQDRTFKLTEGVIDFPGQPKTPATLAGRAVHEMTDVTLVMTIAGPVEKPNIRFSSIPPLPPADVMAYLLFGRPARALNREEYRLADPKAWQALGGFTAKKLQEFLGKDFPLVGNIRVTGDEDRVGVSKPLTKDLSVSFERKTNPVSRDDLNQIRLEYRINRYLGVESQMGRRNTGADVFFNFDF